jgi:hypothetical protein
MYTSHHNETTIGNNSTSSFARRVGFPVNTLGVRGRPTKSGRIGILEFGEVTWSSELDNPTYDPTTFSQPFNNLALQQQEQHIQSHRFFDLVERLAKKNDNVKEKRPATSGYDG